MFIHVVDRQLCSFTGCSRPTAWTTCMQEAVAGSEIDRQKEDSRGRRQGPPVLCTLRNDGIARWHPAHALRAVAIRNREGNSPSSRGPLLAGSHRPKRGRLLACETAKACRELSGARIQTHFTLPTEEKNAVLWVKNATELTGNSPFRYRKDRVL